MHLVHISTVVHYIFQSRDRHRERFIHNPAQICQYRCEPPTAHSSTEVRRTCNCFSHADLNTAWSNLSHLNTCKRQLKTFLFAAHGLWCSAGTWEWIFTGNVRRDLLGGMPVRNDRTICSAAAQRILEHFMHKLVPHWLLDNESFPLFILHYKVLCNVC